MAPHSLPSLPEIVEATKNETTTQGRPNNDFRLPPLLDDIPLKLHPLEGIRSDVPEPIHPRNIGREKPIFKPPVLDLTDFMKRGQQIASMKLQALSGDVRSQEEISRPNILLPELQCPSCGKIMESLDRLASHELVHDILKDHKAKSGKVVLQCPYPRCNVRFKWVASLNFHIEGHRIQEEAVLGARTRQETHSWYAQYKINANFAHMGFFRSAIPMCRTILSSNKLRLKSHPNIDASNKSAIKLKDATTILRIKAPRNPASLIGRGILKRHLQHRNCIGIKPIKLDQENLLGYHSDTDARMNNFKLWYGAGLREPKVVGALNARLPDLISGSWSFSLFFHPPQELGTRDSDSDMTNRRSYGSNFDIPANELHIYALKSAQSVVYSVLNERMEKARRLIFDSFNMPHGFRKIIIKKKSKPHCLVFTDYRSRALRLAIQYPASLRQERELKAIPAIPWRNIIYTKGRWD
eukprot:IDg9747t1